MKGNKKKIKKNKIFNIHFFKMISIFSAVIVSALTFTSFMKDSTSEGKVKNKIKSSSSIFDRR